MEAKKRGPAKLRDPFLNGRDFELTNGYGKQTVHDLPGLFWNPAKQFEYAEQLNRAWSALWTGWISGSATTPPRPFDIFLSHAKRDEERVRSIKGEFEAAGNKVYVDWTEDPLLDRTHVDRITAETLQQRMRQCKALVLALSASSAASPWVQWELGFFDALRGRIFILPLDRDAEEAVSKQEYHQLYPILDANDYQADFVRRYSAALA